MKMRSYMLPKHREFINAIGQHSLKKHIHSCHDEKLVKDYNICVKALTEMRSYHLQVAAKYIVVQSHRHKTKKSFESVSKQGTGGTKLMPFLKDIRDTTQQSHIHPNSNGVLNGNNDK